MARLRVDTSEKSLLRGVRQSEKSSGPSRQPANQGQRYHSAFSRHEGRPLPHCGLVAFPRPTFIFSSRLFKWLLLASSSSTLSNAERSCRETENKPGVRLQITDCNRGSMTRCPYHTSLCILRFSALRSSSIFSAFSDADLYRVT